ncbi:MAG: SGNH/GDSL hydrolase family protein [Bacillus subtilis]|nr:SGNH/GDSL hydrolase family protein [Bacillus subtilis]
MIYRSLKDPAFRLYGSDVLAEPVSIALSVAERERLKTVNPDAAWHALSSTGILAKFTTDSREIRVKVKLVMPANMEYMSAVGQCGVDLYVQSKTGNTACSTSRASIFGQRTRGRTRPLSRRHPAPLPFASADLHGRWRSPSASRTAPRASPSPFPPAAASPCTGRASSRAAASADRACCRRTSCPAGSTANSSISAFQGAAYLEPETAAAIGARPDLDLLFIDAEANAGTSDLMEKRLPAFYAEFRKNHRDTLVLVSRTAFAMDLYDETRVALRERYRRFLSAFAAGRRRKGRTSGSSTDRGSTKTPKPPSTGSTRPMSERRRSPPHTDARSKRLLSARSVR